MNTTDIVLGLIGIALTVMIFSYLLGDNFFFRLALYVLVGVTSGYTAAIIITKVVIPYLVEPLMQVGTPGFYWALIPLAFSILLILLLFPRAVKAGRLPMAFLVGVLAALAIFGVARGTLAPQLIATVNRFTPDLLQQGLTTNWAGIAEGLMTLLGVIAVLFFFHYRTHGKGPEQARSGIVEGLSGIGQIFIGITFGALFVGLYTTALIALISRITWIKDFLVQLF